MSWDGNFIADKSAKDGDEYEYREDGSREHERTTGDTARRSKLYAYIGFCAPLFSYDNSHEAAISSSQPRLYPFSMISLTNHPAVPSPSAATRPGLSVYTSSSLNSLVSPASPSLSSLPTSPPCPDPSHSPQTNPDFPQQPLAGTSAPSPPPLDPDASICAFPQDLTDVVPLPNAEVPLELYVDDEGLSSLEKIYIFCRSKVTMRRLVCLRPASKLPHNSEFRVFMSRFLYTFLPGITPLEGVEYVLPLLSSLAVDDGGPEDAVKEALVVNLVAIMWWFFKHCRLIEDEPPEEPQDPPVLPVQTFTPILGWLLIDHNTMVGGPARFAVVEILNRLHSADDRGEDFPPFGIKERKMLEQEIIQQVIIGMGRLDVSEECFPSPKPDVTSETSSTVPLPSSTHESSLVSLPHSPSAAQSPFSLPFDNIKSSAKDQISIIPAPPSIPSPDVLSSSSGFSPDSTSSQILEQLPDFSLAPASPPPAGNNLGNWIPPSPHPSSEATFGDSTLNEECNNDHDEWLVAEGQHNQDAQEDANQQAAFGRLSSMSLIATVTAHAKLPEDTLRAFADEVAYIGADPLYWVRREASFAVGALAKVVPTEVVLLSLLPMFEVLARDTVWHVRHSAIFALPGILTRLTPQHRRTLALDTLMPLARDLVPTVRSGVLEVLGEVIYAFHEDDEGAPKELVNLFVGREANSGWHQHIHNEVNDRPSNPTTTDSNKRQGALSSVFETDESSEEGETEQSEPGGVPGPSLSIPDDFFRDPSRPLVTSFNYPAVALSLGPRRWSEVRGYYLALTRDGNVRVRRTIAAGLGEMARILGAELAERDLVDIWQDMVHDAEDGQTRLKALGGIYMFIGALEGVVRERVVAGLVELWERWLTGWRERECLTRALPMMAEILEGQGEIVRVLIGKALMDNIAAVREAAIEALTHVICAFESRPLLVEALRDDLQGLAFADLRRRRATYVACCRALVDGENGEAEVAREDFWENIIQLSQDSVIDVRIGVARLLGEVCDKFYPHPESWSPRVLETIRRLAQDPARDVRAFVGFLLMPVKTPRIRLFQTVPTPITPPDMTFATFSRPPPKAPLLDTIMGLDVEDFSADPPVLQEQKLKSDRATTNLIGQGLNMGSPGKVNEKSGFRDTLPTKDPFKPLLFERPRTFLAKILPPD
ncbi:hypothetical protein K439DRAFT_1619480 [Ramaria rubella]|nr:hypothetical protein K439DRAFT_1619480 [Ramaria rubella]